MRRVSVKPSESLTRAKKCTPRAEQSKAIGSRKLLVQIRQFAMRRQPSHGPQRYATARIFVEKCVRVSRVHRGVERDAVRSSSSTSTPLRARGSSLLLYHAISPRCLFSLCDLGSSPRSDFPSDRYYLFCADVLPAAFRSALNMRVFSLKLFTH